MVFWRHKKNDPKDDHKLDAEDRLLHHEGETLIEKPTEYDEEIPYDARHQFDETETEILGEAEEMSLYGYHGEANSESSQGGWWSRLKGGLSKSSNKLVKGITDLVSKRKLDDETLQNLEDLLISADLGPSAAARLVEELRSQRFGKDTDVNDIKNILFESVNGILHAVKADLDFAHSDKGPCMVLICGVNGVGKTTTIGKLASKLVHKDGKKVGIAAADTFRAAAIEQLQVWSDRAHASLIAKEIGADPASVVYEAYEKSVEENQDVLFIDTAGRLHNKANLMAELEKIIRVLKKRDENAPHKVLLILDATTGQNAHAQVEAFREIVNISGLIVTKLDGTAKAGVLVSLAEKYKLPVYAVGVGEGIEDLQTFEPEAFVRALLDFDEIPLPEARGS